MTTTATTRLLQVLKRLLKSQGITYKALSSALQLSEATIKRTLASGDISLERLERICAVIGIDILELAQITAGSQSALLTQLSEAQEQLLAQDHNLFTLFHLLLRGDRVADIVRTYTLDANHVEQLLDKLELALLIERHARGRVRPLASRSLRWHPKGPLMRTYGRAILERFIESDFTGKEEYGRLVTSRLPEESRRMIQRKLTQFMREVESIVDLVRDTDELPADTFFVFAGYRSAPSKLAFDDSMRRKAPRGST